MTKLDHVTISVQDWRKSRDWYRDHLGLRLEFEVAAGGREGLGVAALQDDAGLTLFLEQSAEGGTQCRCVHTFQVADVEETFRMLSAKGIGFLAAPSKRYWGYGAELADPNEHVLYLWDERSMREKA